MAAVDPWGSRPPPLAPPAANHVQTPTRPDASQSPANLAHTISSWRHDLALGPPSPQPSPSIVLVRVRCIPVDWPEQSLLSLVDWSIKDLIAVQMLPFNRDGDHSQEALMRYRSLDMAMEITRALNDYATRITAEIINAGPAPRWHPSDPTSMPAANRQQSLFFAIPLGSMLPPSNGNPFSTSAQNAYPSQSPIGAHRSDRSSRTLISNTLRDDDETRDLLRDPVAFAEHGATAQRRATAPQLPVDRMAALSLNPFATAAGMAAYSPRPPSPPVNGGALTTYVANGHGAGFARHCFPPANPADQNPPCNTLYVGNLPIGTSEEELKRVFSAQRGYKRLCYRTKQNGPMCFVEFADVSSATKALSELYGFQLINSKHSGIRLSFSKNPLGVRSGHQQPPGQAAPGPAAGGAAAAAVFNGGGMAGNPTTGFAIAHGPPPGLAAPPGLRSTPGRASSVNPAAPMALMGTANANGGQAASLGAASTTENYVGSIDAARAPGNFAPFTSNAASAALANANGTYAAWSNASLNYATYPGGNYAISTNTGRNSAPGSYAANAAGNYPGASAFAAFQGFQPAVAASRLWNSPPRYSNEAAGV